MEHEIESLLPEEPVSTCPKYENCNANVCPIDQDWRLRSHLRGESSCHFLRLVVKNAATAEEMETSTYQAAVEVWKHKDELPPILLKQLEKAAQSNRKAIPIPIPIKIDPVKAEKAMLSLQALFGDEVDRPVNRFG